MMETFVVIMKVTSDLLSPPNLKFLPCLNPLPVSPHSDLSQISHCSIKGLLVRKVMRIEMITEV